MRDLAALNVYSLEEFMAVKEVIVKTADVCVEQEEHIRTLQSAIQDLRDNRPEYKNDRMVDRILNRMESCVNFLTQACRKFSSVADAVNEKREALEAKRKESLVNLENSQKERKAAVAEAKAKAVPKVKEEVLPEKSAKKKPGRPSKKK